MSHYTLVFKRSKGGEIFEIHHHFIFTAKLLAKFLRKQGYKTIVFLKVKP